MNLYFTQIKLKPSVRQKTLKCTRDKLFAKHNIKFEYLQYIFKNLQTNEK